MMEMSSVQGCSRCLAHNEHEKWGSSGHGHCKFSFSHIYTCTHIRTHMCAHVHINPTCTNIPTQTYIHTTHTAYTNKREEKKNLKSTTWDFVLSLHVFIFFFNFFLNF